MGPDAGPEPGLRRGTRVADANAPADRRDGLRVRFSRPGDLSRSRDVAGPDVRYEASRARRKTGTRREKCVVAVIRIAGRSDYLQNNSSRSESDGVASS